MVPLTFLQGLQLLGHAVLQFFINPLLYVFVVLMLVDVVRNVKAERRFFGIRVTRIWVPLLKRHLFTLATGLVASLLLVVFGVQVSYSEILIVSGLSLILAMFRFRFLHFGYSILIFILLSYIARSHLWTQSYGNHGQAANSLSNWLSNQWMLLGRAHLAGWFAILCIGFLAEALLTRFYLVRTGTPALLASRRGRQFGATKVQLSLIVPIFILSPGHLQPVGLPAHWPLLYHWIGISLTAMPLFMGCSFLTATKHPTYWLKRRIYSAGILFSLSGCGLAVTVWKPAIHDWPTVGFCVLLLMLIWQEYTIRQFHWREHHDDSLCAPTSEGVVVLHTIKGSLSEALGLVIGETITHVNQVAVHTEYDLHFAFDQNPAYAKLQVVDWRNEIRIVGKPVYAGERHQLGLILVPQDAVQQPYDSRQIGLLQTLYLRSLPLPSFMADTHQFNISSS